MPGPDNPGGRRPAGAKRRTGRALRKGITTGTCAAAGAKAAAQALFASISGPGKGPGRPRYVEVSLPRGGTVTVKVRNVRVEGSSAEATVVKYAGDDPDVTNGADIVATVELAGTNRHRTGVAIRGGVGVGLVTRPGLKTPVGSPAINPVPRKMIRRAVVEAAASAGLTPSVVVTVSVPRGGELAKKTMNPRLGITGGISILGTTGIVEPLSLSAYRHSISCGMDVAVATGLAEIVLSTGRSSEKAAEAVVDLPVHAFVLTGDHMGHALDEAAKRKALKRVTIAGQFGKFTKLASNHFETHCSDSSVELDSLARLCARRRAPKGLVERVRGANTAREVFFMLAEAGLDRVYDDVCRRVAENARARVGGAFTVKSMLVGYDGEVISTHELSSELK